MADLHIENFNFDQKYEFKPALKRKITIAFIVGVVLFLLGSGLVYYVEHTTAGHGHGVEHGNNTNIGRHEDKPVVPTHEEHHYNWYTRILANLWLNSVFFTELAVLGVFFVAVQYVAYAGWSASIRRAVESFGAFLPVTGALMLLLFFVGGHDLFHWTHHGLYEEGGKEFDEIIAGKSGFFFFPLEGGSFPVFWIIRLIAYFVLWYMFWKIICKFSLREDGLLDKSDYTLYRKNVTYSAIFLVIFAVTSSTSAWDWVMSIDTHWYSTMFGWYMFASGWVSCLAVITLMITYLKDQGYLEMVNENHLHDLGKFMFAFSIFWTYIWFSQFLLINYANITEETIYFHERMYGYNGIYSPLIIFNVIINFLFPFLFLMTRDAKRKSIFLKVTAYGILMGHYLDFFVMVMPGTTKEHGGFHILEIGTTLMFASAFVYVIAQRLSKNNLVAKNHPMMEESLAHSI